MISSILSKPFTFVTSSVLFSIDDAEGIRNFTIPEGDYHFHLQSGSILQLIQGEINAPWSPAEPWVVDIDNNGKLFFEILSPFSSGVITFASETFRDMFGFTNTSFAVETVVTAEYQPHNMLFFIGRKDSDWKTDTKMHVASLKTAGGQVYSLFSGRLNQERKITFEWIPKNHTLKTSTNSKSSVFYPDETNRMRVVSESLSYSNPYSIVDFLYTSFNKLLSFKLGNFTDISDIDSWETGYFLPSSYETNNSSLMREGWETYRSFTVDLILSGSGEK